MPIISNVFCSIGSAIDLALLAPLSNILSNSGISFIIRFILLEIGDKTSVARSTSIGLKSENCLPPTSLKTLSMLSSASAAYIDTKFCASALPSKPSWFRGQSVLIGFSFPNFICNHISIVSHIYPTQIRRIRF